MGVTDDLRSLGEEGLVALLRERPMLIDYCGSMAELARFVESPYAAGEALGHTNAFEHATAEVIAALGPVHAQGVAAALGGAGDDISYLEGAITRLEGLLLATRLTDGCVAPAAGLAHHLGRSLGLGRPLGAMLSQFEVGAARRAAGLLGLPKVGTKAELVAQVSEALSDSDTVRKALADAPTGATDLVERLLTTVVVDVGYGRPPPPAAWLIDRLMLVRASSYGGQAELAREVALALRGPVLRVVSPAPPPLSGRAARDVDASAAHKAGTVLPLLSSLVDALGAEPAKAIQSGELGVRDLRRLAKAAEVDEATAGRLLEMARSGGLVGTVVTPVTPKARRGARWQPDPAPLVEWLPTTVYDTWLGQGPGSQWAALAGAWLDSRAWPSRSGAPSSAGKTTAAFSRHDDASEAPRLRGMVLELLAGLGAGQAAGTGELAAALGWHHVRSAAWVHTDSVSLTEDVIAEAELLGVVADGALSSFGRTLLTDREAAARQAGGLLPVPVRSFLVQADMSAIATGPLDRDLAEELSAMADVESRGVATIWRFSEASVRRALDQGDTADRMLVFLDAHAAKGVPQPLRYLVNDAARRHGKVRVAAVTSVVTSDDPALLAEVRAARKTAKLELYELAPTVLASPRPVDAVLLTLRAAGFLPTEARGGGASVARPERRRAPAAPAGRSAPGPGAPEADLVPLARRLLKDRSRLGQEAVGLDSLAALEALALEIGALRNGGPNWWGDDAEGNDDRQLVNGDAYEILSEAASYGAEVGVFTSTGRNGTEVVGTVALLTRSTVVLRDDRGRKKTLPLASIVSIWEEE